MKRRLLKLGLLLLAGAIINVAVAWGCAYWILIPQLLDSERAVAVKGSTYDQWIVSVYRKSGQLRILSGWREHESHVLEPPTTTQPGELLPNWARALSPAPDPTQNVRLMVGDARGWPVRSLYSCIEVDVEIGNGVLNPRGLRTFYFSKDGTWVAMGEPKLVVAGLAVAPIADTSVMSPFHVRTLPTRPLWPGFAINTISYAGIVWLLFFAPFRFRRWRRNRRGLCPACAYPVGSSGVCTECGNKLCGSN